MQRIVKAADEAPAYIYEANGERCMIYQELRPGFVSWADIQPSADPSIYDWSAYREQLNKIEARRRRQFDVDECEAIIAALQAEIGGDRATAERLAAAVFKVFE